MKEFDARLLSVEIAVAVVEVGLQSELIAAHRRFRAEIGDAPVLAARRKDTRSVYAVWRKDLPRRRKQVDRGKSERRSHVAPVHDLPADGVGIADLITSIKLKANNFVYCDEKFSHVHSVAETAFLALMTDILEGNQQLFFTTHNTDVLDMNLPFHSFAFLRRDVFDDNRVTCIYASDYLKKNNQSLKNAVENDVFSTSPDTDSIYNLNKVFQEAGL